MSEQVIKLLITGTLDTLQMTVISTIMAMIIGIPLGVVLVVTSKGHILENAAHPERQQAEQQKVLDIF